MVLATGLGLGASVAGAAAQAEIARRALVVQCVRLPGIAERRVFEAVAVVDAPVELEQSLGAVVPELSTAPFEYLVAIDLLPLEKTEHEQPVLHQRAAGIDVVAQFVLLPVFLDGIAAIALRVVREARAAGERSGAPVGVGAEFPFVGAAFGDHVDHAAQRAPELRAVAAGLDLLFLQRLERDFAEGQAVDDVGDIETVDVVDVLGDRGTTEGREVAEAVVAAHRAGCQQGHARRVAAYREAVDLLFGHDGGGFDRRHIDRIDDARADHRHRIQVGRITRSIAEVHLRGRADVDDDAPCSGAIATDVVLARWQLREAIGAAAANGHGAGEARGRVGDGDGVP